MEIDPNVWKDLYLIGGDGHDIWGRIIEKCDDAMFPILIKVSKSTRALVYKETFCRNLRSGKYKVDYFPKGPIEGKSFSNSTKDWSNDELLSQIKELDCSVDKEVRWRSWNSREKLYYLPNLPNCEKLYCCSNALSCLPELPRCKEVRCYDNDRPMMFPELPMCENLYCDVKLVDSIAASIKLYRHRRILAFITIGYMSNILHCWSDLTIYYPECPDFFTTPMKTLVDNGFLLM
jgi:hypothetical protein